LKYFEPNLQNLLDSNPRKQQPKFVNTFSYSLSQFSPTSPGHLDPAQQAPSLLSLHARTLSPPLSLGRHLTQDENQKPKQTLVSEHENSQILKRHKTRYKNDFFIQINTTTFNPRRSPSSHPHLIIGMKNEFLAHFYSRNYEMKLGGGKKPHPL
jgi:hypothetical protein